jgi:hypothetical protein
VAMWSFENFKKEFAYDLGNGAVKKIEFKYVNKPTKEVRRFNYKNKKVVRQIPTV